ncbi:MAG: tetratricopeptide repeat protein [Bacteroidetes bacterium]|nr:tetratricopeptide repeat protein [Bacteroidota bacterium]
MIKLSERATYPNWVVVFAILVGSLLGSFPSMAKKYDTLYVKDIEQQPAQNRLNYFFSMYHDWKKVKEDFKRIDSLVQIADKLNDTRLLEYAESARLAFLYLLTDEPNEKEKYYKEGERYVLKASNKELRPFYYFTLGMYFFYKGDIKKSLPFLYDSKMSLEKIGYTSLPHSSFYYNGFFNLYYYFQDYQKALEYCQLSLEDKYNLLYNPADYYDNMGMCYLRMKEYDKAENEFKKAISLAKKTKDKALESLAVGNLGINYWFKNDYKKAIPLIQFDLKTTEKEWPLNAAECRLYIACCLIKLDSLEQAKKYLPTYRTKDRYWGRNYNRLLYMTLSLYYDKIKNHKLASTYKDSLLAISDSIKVETDIIKIKVFESQLEAERFINEKNEIETAASYERNLRNIIVVVLFFLFGLVVMWLNERRRRTIRLENYKREQAEEKLLRANELLTRYVLNMKEKNELLEQIRGKITVEEDADELIGTELTWKNLQKSMLLTEKDWMAFKNLFEESFPDFFERLQQKYPDLKLSEIRLAALEMLHLTDKVKGNMLGISAESVKKARYRIRKKYPDLLGG